MTPTPTPIITPTPVPTFAALQMQQFAMDEVLTHSTTILIAALGVVIFIAGLTALLVMLFKIIK